MKGTYEDIYSRCEETAGHLLWLGCAAGGQPQARIDGLNSQLVRKFIFTQLMKRKIPAGHILKTRCTNGLCLTKACITTELRGAPVARAHADGKYGGPGKYLSRIAARPPETTKLSFEIARHVRASDERSEVLAKKYGVSRTAIKYCKAGVTWREAAPGSSVFNFRG